MSIDDDSLEQRYGAPSRRRRITGAVVIGLVLVALGVFFVVAILLPNANPPVSSKELTYDVVDDHTATVTVRITFDDEAVEATCSARAISHDKAVVGEVSFRPDPADGPDYTLDISTDRRATAVEWIGCTTKDRPRPR